MTKQKPEEPFIYNATALSSGRVSYCVTQKMVITQTPNTRSVAIYLPLQEDIPTFSVQIISYEGAVPLTVYSLTINENVEEFMQVGITAQTLSREGLPAAGVYFCNLIAIGKPVVPFVACLT